ncbi:MAG: helix-turn-helix domain-containing protein [Lentisphaerae bacterium]|nr:helix-turn-helix domain-containing protein [Lentisphaerota bacterium]
MLFGSALFFMDIEKEQFGLKIKRLLSARNLTQKELAEALGISPPAVTYLLRNELRTTPEHFDRIMEFLRADASEIKELQKLWFLTQPANRNSENINLFAIRCSRGKSLADVSADTGIDIERLRFLENKPGAIPTPGETALLKGLYGTDSDALDDLDDEFSSKSGVAEEIAGEIISGKVSLPVLSLEVFSRASRAGTLENFLGDLPFNNALFEIAPEHQKRAKAVLSCRAEDIHYGFPGTVQLLLADADPLYSDHLHIGKGARGGFALWQKRKRVWHYFGAEHPEPRLANTWSVPVLELKFTSAPFNTNSGKNR